MKNLSPSYIQAHESGLLRKRVRQSSEILESCTLCPRKCRVNRKQGEKGICRTQDMPVVYGYHAHFGEEAPLVGKHGSGTIFFTHCNLKCCFCQNFDISHRGSGRKVTDDELAQMMISLQMQGCHNINFVTPSHVVPQILSAVALAVQRGLSIPLVYNSSCYDSIETLEILDGLIDIYMPDFKFWDPRIADITCGAPDYPDVARKALAEMHRQAGDLFIDSSGIARRGVLVRHLVMPEGIAGTREIMHFIASRISTDTYVNIMNQYRPCGDTGAMKPLQRRITEREYQDAIESAKESGLFRLDGAEFII